MQNTHKARVHLKEWHVLHSEFPHSIIKTPLAVSKDAVIHSCYFLTETLTQHLDHVSAKTKVCYKLHSLLCL